MHKKSSYSQKLFAGLIFFAVVNITSCDNNNPVPEKEKGGSFILSVTGESSEYLLQSADISTGEMSIANNKKQLEQSGYTWIFNRDPSMAIGLIYQQGDPGIGLGYSIDASNNLVEQGQFQISSRFTSYGFFDRYALTSVGGQTLASDASRSDGVTFNFIDLKNNLALQTKTIPTLNITGNGEQATCSGIVDMGNGEFLTGLVVSQPRDPNAGGGASSGTITYPDSVWVASFDANLNLKHLYRDNRISYSSGRFRSQYYSQIGKANNGNVYVFSGSYETTTTRPCGALRIRKNATTFDPDYYFNIADKTSGLRFRKVWHITGSSFLLEVYNDVEVTINTAATQYAVANMENKTLSMITGIPAKDKITATGLPVAYNGKMYFPITEESADPTIYVIDPATAKAVKGLSIKGATNINAVGRLTE